MGGGIKILQGAERAGTAIGHSAADPQPAHPVVLKDIISISRAAKVWRAAKTWWAANTWHAAKWRARKNIKVMASGAKAGRSVHIEMTTSPARNTLVSKLEKAAKRIGSRAAREIRRELPQDALSRDKLSPAVLDKLRASRGVKDQLRKLTQLNLLDQTAKGMFSRNAKALSLLKGYSQEVFENVNPNLRDDLMVARENKLLSVNASCRWDATCGLVGSKKSRQQIRQIVFAALLHHGYATAKAMKQELTKACELVERQGGADGELSGLLQDQMQTVVDAINRGTKAADALGAAPKLRNLGAFAKDGPSMAELVGHGTVRDESYQKIIEEAIIKVAAHGGAEKAMQAADLLRNPNRSVADKTEIARTTIEALGWKPGTNDSPNAKDNEKPNTEDIDRKDVKGRGGKQQDKSQGARAAKPEAGPADDSNLDESSRTPAQSAMAALKAANTQVHKRTLARIRDDIKFGPKDSETAFETVQAHIPDLQLVFQEIKANKNLDLDKEVLDTVDYITDMFKENAKSGTDFDRHHEDYVLVTNLFKNASRPTRLHINKVQKRVYDSRPLGSFL